MKTATFLTLAAIGKLAAAHATFQEMLVNGKSSGVTGVRGTSNQNNPILSTAENLASDMMICKGGVSATGSVSVASGDKLTLQWHHNNPMTTSGDTDVPIAGSHKGPIIVWVADAKTEGKGAAWVKIQEEGLSGGKWAVDNFITNKGAISVTVPDLAAGDYLIRSEIIALHEGNRAGAAQFYNGCGQITVTSAGKLSITSGVDIKTVYKTDDAGVFVDIYSGITSYAIPGPKVNAGFGGAAAGTSAAATTTAAATATKPATTAAPTSTKPATTAAPVTTKPTTTAAAPSSYVVTKPTTLSTVVKTTTSSAATPTGGASGTVAKWGQCGGLGFTGATGCVAGSTCKVQNPYYSQCL